MTLRYLLDTNVLSEPIRPQPDAGVVARLEEFHDQLASCATVWHELVFGVERLADGKRREHLRRYLREVAASALPILPYDAAAASWHGQQRARLAGQGLTPSFAHGQIAAVAALHGLVIVTRNLKDFKHFSDVDAEDWFSGQR